MSASPGSRNPTSSSWTPSLVRSAASTFTSAQRSPAGSEASSHRTQPPSSGTYVRIPTENAVAPVGVVADSTTQTTRCPATDTSPQSPRVPAETRAMQAAFEGAVTTVRFPCWSTAPSLEIAGASPGGGVTTTVDGAGEAVAGPGLGLGESAAVPSPRL